MTKIPNLPLPFGERIEVRGMFRILNLDIVCYLELVICDLSLVPYTLNPQPWFFAVNRKLIIV